MISVTGIEQLISLLGDMTPRPKYICFEGLHCSGKNHTIREIRKRIPIIMYSSWEGMGGRKQLINNPNGAVGEVLPGVHLKYAYFFAVDALLQVDSFLPLNMMIALDRSHLSMAYYSPGDFLEEAYTALNLRVNILNILVHPLRENLTEEQREYILKDPRVEDLDEYFDNLFLYRNIFEEYAPFSSIIYHAE